MLGKSLLDTPFHYADFEICYSGVGLVIAKQLWLLIGSMPGNYYFSVKANTTTLVCIR